VDRVCERHELHRLPQWISLAGAIAFVDLAYDDTSVIPGQTYSYFVRASNSGGTANSNTINISLPTTICQPPPAPFALTAKAICDIASSPAAAIRLTWTASANATSYAVFRAGTKIADVSTTSFVDTANIVAGQSYAYLVRASGPGGTTDSDEFDLTVDPAVCQSACSFACAANVVATAAEQFPVRFSLQQQPPAQMWRRRGHSETARIRPS